MVGSRVSQPREREYWPNWLYFVPVWRHCTSTVAKSATPIQDPISVALSELGRHGRRSCSAYRAGMMTTVSSRRLAAFAREHVTALGISKRTVYCVQGKVLGLLLVHESVNYTLPLPARREPPTTSLDSSYYGGTRIGLVVPNFLTALGEQQLQALGGERRNELRRTVPCIPIRVNATAGILTFGPIDSIDLTTD